ncbi:MAG: adenylate kinase [Dysgonamonadaceae bacterium]|jgi:adenylate kinase|nr:adenylate kinase [Dysgonamonadaceae bacterium]
MKPLNIVIFGAPGSGKGTQSELLIRQFGLNHISTGDVLRKEIADKTVLGSIAKSHINKGELVPDNLIIDMLAKVLDNQPPGAGVIFDGFPRTLEQGKALNEMLAARNTELSIVINLTVAEEELIHRLLKRGEISGRSDDNLETITARLNVYKSQTSPLVDFYQREGKLVEVAANGRSIEEIYADVERAIDSILA